MRKLQIECILFMMAFARDADFHDAAPRTTYLDLQSGDVLWVYDDDEDAWMEEGTPAEENRALRERVENEPDGYLRIPGRTHGEHHDILQDFIDSGWTTDKELEQEARNAYHGSIGAWKKHLTNSPEALHAFEDFKDQKIKEMAEELLRGHGIDPEWK